LEAQDLLRLFCDALEIPEASLKSETNVSDVEEWDSIGWLTIMSMLDEQYGVQIESRQIRTVKKVQDLLDLILRSERI